MIYQGEKNALHRFMLGKLAFPDHPTTPLNPNGRDGFVITEIKREEDGRFFFRGTDTMWFGESIILRFETNYL